MPSLLFTITHSTEDPERAAGALFAAWTAAEAGTETALWLTHEGVRLAVPGVAETLREPYAPDAAGMLEAMATKGVRLCADRAAFVRRGFEPDQLRRGAELLEPTELARLVAAGYVPVHV
jgi:predicted peroxiredoxin